MAENLDLLSDDDVNMIDIEQQFESKSTTTNESKQSNNKDLDLFHSIPSSPSQSSTSSSATTTKHRKKKRSNDIDDDDEDGEDNDDDEDDNNENVENNRKRYEPKWCSSNILIHILNRKELILQLQCNLFCGHKWSSFIQLSDALITDRRLPCNLIMRNFLFILFKSKPNLLDNSERFDSAYKFVWNLLFLMIDRYETMIELINYFIWVGYYHQQPSLLAKGKSMILDLNQEIERRYRRGQKKQQFSKSFHMLEIVFRIYMEYFDLIDWKLNGQTTSSAIRLDKLKTNFNDLIEHFAVEPLPELNLDIVPLIMLELFFIEENRQNGNNHYHDEALEMLTKYSKTFPDNLNGHVYLYEFLKDLKRHFNHSLDDNSRSIQIECLRNIERLCPDSKYVLRLAQQIVDDEPIECLEMITNFLDYHSNSNSLKAWKILHRILIHIFNRKSTTDIDDDILLKIRKFLFIKLKYWQHIHFRLDQLNSFLSEWQRNNSSGTEQFESTNNDDDIRSVASTTFRSIISTTSTFQSADSSTIQSSSSSLINKRDLYKYKGKIIAEIHRKFPDLINCDYTHLIYLKIKTQNL
ncbi:LOW QUALITY PROTEIN: uncharacterized protein LOC113793825 [Dermatophagoides pteronyssinus]|uniref:LOW QUALITY PROTEIN: uncharacterized protein LOC113793825 n=1 Tax=Dermatophagoides pteronyssinus TaxID=6956 RepID=UPI003F66326B